MVGDELAVLLGNRGQLCGDLGVQASELGGIGLGAVGQRRDVDAVEVLERRRHQADGLGHPSGVGEPMGIDVGLVLAPVLFGRVPVVLEGEGIEVLAQLQDRDTVGCRGVERVEQPDLEAEAVRHDEVGLVQLGDLRRGRLELVWIGTGRHQNLDICLVADELVDDIAEEAVGDDDERPVARRAGGGTRRGEQHEGSDEDRGQPGGWVVP